MSAERAKAFIKTSACPSSEDLSRSQSPGFPHNKAEQLAHHIAGCEFCAAENSLLSAFALTSEGYKPAEMPAHLRRLVESLLIRKLKDPDKYRNTARDRFLRAPGFGI